MLFIDVMLRWNKKFKVLRCSICLIGWLGLLLFGLSYWRAETTSLRNSHVLARQEAAAGSRWVSDGSSSSDKPRLKKLRQLCNPPDRIHAASEGRLTNTAYDLVGIIVNVRHGDRGPMIPVRNLSHINCSHRSYMSNAYKNFVGAVMNASRSSDFTVFAGSFVKYPILPSLYHCSVAHLTPQGVVQHVKLGKVLKDIYINSLSLLSHPWEVDDVVIHSTKFRRTYQSALAFLYGFLPKFDVSQLRMTEGRGVSFCSNNCRCDRVAALDEKHDLERKLFRKSHPGVMELLEKLSAIVKEGPGAADITNPLVMRDALMVYACHGYKLPCVGGVCVHAEDVSSIISYEEWERRQKKSRAKHKASKLKIYGLLKDIAQTMDTMMRDGKPKFVLYSGHDKTLNYLLDSLSLPAYQLPNYASRIIFEVYKNVSSKPPGEMYRSSFFFRIIYNGKDITKFLPFCSVKTVSHYTSPNGFQNAITLCPITSFDNFLRASNYFAEFNATNFRSACSLSKSSTGKGSSKRRQ
ncbi:Histidine phosphatase superfamily clade-2 [Trinorchestia longiramus]|nr:Histidine phosphatase superfamily clade-2 [Trinorchestia longiramus]